MSRLPVLLAAASAAALPTIAQAANAPEQIATYRDWIVYRANVDGETICYAAATPKDMEPESVDHGNIFFMVSTWKSGAAANQPSFMSGYDLKDRPVPVVRIGANKWDMFSAGQEGFVEDDRSETRLVSAMRRGAEMRLSAMSERGTSTEYTFSLLGISNALDRAARACR